MLRLKEGDTVRIVDRTPTAADAKAGLYFNHYRNLSGTVFKLYGTGETQQAAVDIALESLPEEVASRHREVAQQMRASLSGGGKRGLAGDAENGFRLRYVVLVGVTDLVRHKPATRS